MDTVALVLLLFGFLFGFISAWLWARSRNQEDIRELQSRLSSTAQEMAAHKSAASELRLQIEVAQTRDEENRNRLEQEQVARAQAETTLEAERAHLAEQRQLLENAQSRLKDVFSALASDTLKASTDEFLKLAKAQFEVLQQRASGDLGQRQEAIQALVTPLKTSLTNLDQRLVNVESDRQVAHGQLTTLMRDLASTGKELRQETGSLANALRRPWVKGTWGQMTLRRSVELAGMSPHCDFREQMSVETEEGWLRPDLVIFLPTDRQIVVDAKVPLQAFLEAASANTPTEQNQAMERHASLVRQHVQKLSGKAYWSQFDRSPEFVVCFLPGESFFSAALQQDHTLIEDALGKRVVLASPTTLIALLHAVAHGWRQEQLAKNAEEISAHGKDLYEKIRRFVEHIENLRTGLDGANAAFNAAVGSLEARVLPSARRFHDLGVATLEDIPSAEPTQIPLRQLATTAAAGDEA